MVHGVKIVTTRGETYVFVAGLGSLPIGQDTIGSEFIRVTRGPDVLAVFPSRNVEAVLRMLEIEGEVVP